MPRLHVPCSSFHHCGAFLKVALKSTPCLFFHSVFPAVMHSKLFSSSYLSIILIFTLRHFFVLSHSSLPFTLSWSSSYVSSYLFLLSCCSRSLAGALCFALMVDRNSCTARVAFRDPRNCLTTSAISQTLSRTCCRLLHIPVPKPYSKT